MAVSKRRRLFCVYVSVLISGLAYFKAACAQGVSNHVDWQVAAGEEHFETALAQNWFLPPGSRIERFQFSAIRFHLGYFQLKLLSIADFAKQHSKEIAESQKVDPSLNS